MASLAPTAALRLSTLSLSLASTVGSTASLPTFPPVPLSQTLDLPANSTGETLSRPPTRQRSGRLKRRRNDEVDEGWRDVASLAAPVGRRTAAQASHQTPPSPLHPSSRALSRRKPSNSPSPTTPRSPSSFLPRLSRPSYAALRPSSSLSTLSTHTRGGTSRGTRSFWTFGLSRKSDLSASVAVAGPSNGGSDAVYSNYDSPQSSPGAGGPGPDRDDFEKAAARRRRQARAREQSPPRPKSPYGEINALARHPTLYDPVLKPRFPIVLCHGLYGFDVRGPGFFRLHYWGDLLKILRGKIGAEVFVTAVPGTGSVKNRAHVLHKALEDTPALLNKDLNFLAHSMGGLDARYLISNLRPSLYHPRSLTTISTPHRGSEFMAWCRANIGIGTDYDSSEALNLRRAVSSSLDDPDDESVPLPYSLKSPILSREQVEAAKKAATAEKAAEKVRQATSGILPFNLSTSVTSYLLNLLDSPAYANLDPSFLRDAFNPSTPDREGVKYYSIGARTDKIPIWHPLWLPKLVLDGAEAARVAQGVACPPEWRGNDGLVSLESARWGEFLGTFDHCDHWEIRGSSGLSSAEASKQAIEQVTQSEIRDTPEPKQGEKAEKVQGGKEDKEDKGWQWQDVYALVGNLTGGGHGDGKKEAGPSKPAKVEEKKHDSHDAEGLASAASWIIRQLPGADSPPSPSSSGALAPSSASSAPAELPTTSRLSSAASHVSTAASSAASSVSTAATSAASTVVDNVVHNPATRLMYGAPGLSSSASDKAASSSSKPAKPEKFSLERMALAICRKLHQDGF